MNDMTVLKAYAKGRQLPAYKLLGTIDPEWLEYAFSVYKNTDLSSDYAKYQREKDNIIGTHVESYNELTKYYNQFHPTDLKLPETYNILSGVYDIRFGKLEVDSTLPTHLDEPFSLRSLCIIKGKHLFVSENNTTIMNPGELYFVNGCYKHSTQNLSNQCRVALLTKYPTTKENIEIIKNAIL